MKPDGPKDRAGEGLWSGKNSWQKGLPEGCKVWVHEHLVCPAARRPYAEYGQVRRPGCQQLLHCGCGFQRR